MNECTDYLNDPFVGKRRIVCAAINYKNTIVLGIRHHDSFMNEEIKRLKFLLQMNGIERVKSRDL